MKPVLKTEVCDLLFKFYLIKFGRRAVSLFSH